LVDVVSVYLLFLSFIFKGQLLVQYADLVVLPLLINVYVLFCLCLLANKMMIMMMISYRITEIVISTHPYWALSSRRTSAGAGGLGPLLSLRSMKAGKFRGSNVARRAPGWLASGPPGSPAFRAHT